MHAFVVSCEQRWLLNSILTAEANLSNICLDEILFELNRNSDLYGFISSF